MTVVRAVADSVFEWDSFKDKSNLAKHGISFEEAIDVFFDAAAISGDASVDDEDRSFTIGRSRYLHFLVVVHTERRERTRIISARPATRHEERTYRQ